MSFDLSAVENVLAAGLAPEFAPEFAQLRARIERRVQAGTDLTVVGLLGATGSGKSTLFNALVGRQVAATSLRRPTTARPLAAIPVGHTRHLQWLDECDFVEDDALENLILVDLPDIDSIRATHQQIVRKFLQKVDVLVWVLDPQKYNDRLLHEDFLRHFSGHSAVTFVVMTHLDTLTEDEANQLLAAAQKSLTSDGIDTPIWETPGQVAQLKTALFALADQKEAAIARLQADYKHLRQRIKDHLGATVPAVVTAAQMRICEDAVVAASGVKKVALARQKSYYQKARLWTGWPVLSWLQKLRPDPLVRLRLDAGSEVVGKSSLPPLSEVQKAQLQRALRRLVVPQETTGLWQLDLRTFASKLGQNLPDLLDRALAKVDLEARHVPWWWRVFFTLQTILLLCGLCALGWFALAWIGASYGFVVSFPLWHKIPVPVWLGLSGFLGGWGVAVVGVLVANIGKKRAYKKSLRKLRQAVRQSLTENLIAPLDRRMRLYKRLSENL